MTAAQPGPIESATADLVSFVERASGGTVRVGVPQDSAEDELWLWPYELRPQLQTTGTGPRHPYRFAVHYLVTGPLARLDLLLTEAVRVGEPELTLQPPDPATWRALGLVPRPVLGFQMPASVTYSAPELPVVRGPLVLKSLDLRPLTGTVLGPGDQPVAGIRVEIDGTRLSTYTDPHGQFAFPGVPVGDRLGLRVLGRGRVFTASVQPTGDEPVTIHCGFTEGSAGAGAVPRT